MYLNINVPYFDRYVKRDFFNENSCFRSSEINDLYKNKLIIANQSRFLIIYTSSISVRNLRAKNQYVNTKRDRSRMILIVL
jgi:hypothetical protein